MIFEKEHELVRQLAKEFAENEIKPTAEEVDETGEFPMEIYQKMAKAGYQRLMEVQVETTVLMQ